MALFSFDLVVKTSVCPEKLIWSEESVFYFFSGWYGAESRSPYVNFERGLISEIFPQHQPTIPRYISPLVSNDSMIYTYPIAARLREALH